MVEKIYSASLRLTVLTAVVELAERTCGAARVRRRKDAYVGPGILECNSGQCNFSLKPGLGCSDPCHTFHSDHMYDRAFDEVSNVSRDFAMSVREPSNDHIAGEPCYHRSAKNIDAYYPDKFVSIEDGCIAKCSGCKFSPTITIGESV